MEVVGVDYFDFIYRTWGVERAKGIKAYVRDLVDKRNRIAHGDDSVYVTVEDVRRLLKWSTRAARACDVALLEQLVAWTGSGWEASP
jgi:hypothetical protein